MNPALFIPLIQAFSRLLEKRKKIRALVLPLIVKAAADGALPDNAARREFVVAYLMREHGMPESTARLLTEAGIAIWKKIEKKRLKKEAKKQ